MTGPKNLLLSLVGVLGIAGVGLAAPALPQPGERAPAGWTGVTGKWEELCKNHGHKPPQDSDHVLTVDIFCWRMKQKHNDKRDDDLLGRDLSSSFCESIAKSNLYFPGCDKSKGDGSSDRLRSAMHNKRDDKDPK